MGKFFDIEGAITGMCVGLGIVVGLLIAAGILMLIG